MQIEISRFQERMALLAGGGALLGLAVSKRRPRWGGLILIAMGGLLVSDGIVWLEHRVRQRQARRENLRGMPSPRLDPVTESSEESFPASDAPAWAMGK